MQPKEEEWSYTQRTGDHSRSQATQAHLEECSGRGLFLMRELMDEVHFNESGNQVTLVIRSDAVTEEGGGEAEEA